MADEKTIEIDGLTYRIGDRIPIKRKLIIRPNAPVDNRSSWTPSRHK